MPHFGQEHVERYRATDGAEGTSGAAPKGDQQKTEREIPVVVLERA